MFQFQDINSCIVDWLESVEGDWLIVRRIIETIFIDSNVESVYICKI